MRLYWLIAFYFAANKYEVQIPDASKIQTLKEGADNHVNAGETQGNKEHFAEFLL